MGKEVGKGEDHISHALAVSQW